MELAIFMYREDRLTLGQASAFAEVSQEHFLRALGSRGVAIHYGLDDLEHDLGVLGHRSDR